MKTVDQFRSEYSRTEHVGAEPDGSYRFPVTSHGPMAVAFNRVRDFTAAMVQDLQLLDRNHAVSFFNSFYAILRSGDFSSGGCARAHPLGVVPEIRADCSQSVRIFIAFFFLVPSSNRETFLLVDARKRTHWV